MSDVIRHHHTCPTCSSHYIERPIPQPRAVRVYFSRVFGWRVYRCGDCGELFYDRRLKRKWREAPTSVGPSDERTDAYCSLARLARGGSGRGGHPPEALRRLPPPDA